MSYYRNRLSQNLKINPTKLCRRSETASSLSFKHISLDLEAELPTCLILPGLLGFNTGFCGMYDSLPSVPYTSDSFRYTSHQTLSDIGIDRADTMLSILAGIFSSTNTTDQAQHCRPLVSCDLISSRALQRHNFLQ